MSTSTRLFVGNLNFDTTDEGLSSHFPKSLKAFVVRERENARSRGFGFVSYATSAEAESAAKGLHGTILDGRELTVRIESPKATGGSPSPKPSPKPQKTPTKPSKDPKPFPIHPVPHPLVDIGANLTNRTLAPHIDAILAQSAAANVKTILITGTSLKASKEALQMCIAQGDNIHGVKLYATAGVHPHDASHTIKSGPGWITQLETLITENKPHIKAVGECGLDYDRNFSTPADQLTVFEAQLHLAQKLALPVFLHNRDAHDDFLRLLRKYPSVRACVHCYTDDDASHLQAYIDAGYYIGITGWVCDERRGLKLAEIIHKIPMGQLMVETDAPYLLPRNVVGRKVKQNEPGLLGWVVKKVAECYGCEGAEVARRTTENAERFFGI
ncbi:uncharacterized protein EV422DRAFT_503923 [Fimicolochytrium jonesii]|uniref:uncharacterized protein n=1 Tax=Fimicolochytrium jonesii TaxID=1396493 RepID=UPI0022FE833A|nr:uncharacterized protein EV422DRAFT_503923 [Fimicolochytrium jonesii]KAI8825175.1 hypothetical protein EV422DRAFT_503923 [Fimicolochytrium jonesii]